jgi:rubredoxin
VAIALASELASPAPAALIDGDQMSIVELAEGRPGRVALVRETKDSDVKPGMVAAGGGRKGKRTEYRCAACGYGIVVYERPPSCPMCRKPRWEHVESRLSSPLLDALALPFGTESQRRSLHAPSLPTAEKSIRYVRPGQAGASLEKMTPAEELEQLGSAL